jgi:hypothetical protein
MGRLLIIKKLISKYDKGSPANPEKRKRAEHDYYFDGGGG